ncbi:MAG: hypothetical protein FD123_4224 [Bacteroidetes bacterium]|nr:MAG: hypothetical protein FD123_4224 [Bacteroidota bacterium]
MNNYIRESFLKLPAVSREQLRRQFSGSPVMLRLLDLLEHSTEKKFGVHEAVGYIYKEEQDEGNFEVLRNRFFKLRKKLIEALESRSGTPAGEKESGAAGFQLLPLEQEYYRCRTLVQDNHFQEARKRLEKLMEECWKKNIFELLPDAINQVIFCNFTLNVFRDNEKLYKQLEEASVLLNSLNQQRICARKAYDQAARFGYDKARPHVARMKTIALQHKNFPRFEIYYQFTAFTLGTSSYGNDVRVLARHQNRIRELMIKYPDIPSAFYEAQSAELMQYYMLNAEGFYAFQRGDIEECYRCFVESWNISEHTPGFRIRRSDSQYANRVVIEIATGRFREALKTAEEMLEFLKDQKEAEKRLKAYSEMLQVYTFAYPDLVPPNPEFLLGKVDEYLRHQKEEKSMHYGQTLMMKAVFLLQSGKLKEALKVSKLPDFRKALEHEQVSVYLEIFDYAAGSRDKVKAQAIRKKIEQAYMKSREASVTLTLKRALVLMDVLEGKK